MFFDDIKFSVLCSCIGLLAYLTIRLVASGGTVVIAFFGVLCIARPARLDVYRPRY